MNATVLDTSSCSGNIYAETYAMEPDRLTRHNFRRLRKEKRWSQQTVADKADCEQSYISKIETATASFGRDAEEKFAAIFEVDPMEFYRMPEDAQAPQMLVSGHLTEAGVILNGNSSEPVRVPYPPGINDSAARAQHIYVIVIRGNFLQPFLRDSWALYIQPSQRVGSGQFALWRDMDGIQRVKEIDMLSDDELLLKSIGKGPSVKISRKGLLSIDLIIWIRT